MEAVVALPGLVASALKLLQIVASLLTARSQADPAESDDGVAVTRFVTPPIQHPTVEKLRSRKRRAGVYLMLIFAGFVLGLVLVGRSPWLWAVLVAELVVLAGFPIMTLRRKREPHEPANSVQRVVVVSGPLEGVVRRLRRAFRELGALSLHGTSIVATEARFEIEGGNGLWGTDGDVGYRVRATVTPAGHHWEVAVESLNYAPSLIQSLRNPRNVARVLRHLLA